MQVTRVVVYNNFRSCKKSQPLGSYRLFLLSCMNTIQLTCLKTSSKNCKRNVWRLFSLHNFKAIIYSCKRISINVHVHFGMENTFHPQANYFLHETNTIGLRNRSDIKRIRHIIGLYQIARSAYSESIAA